MQRSGGPGGLLRLGRSPSGRSHNCYAWDRLTILKIAFRGAMLAASFLVQTHFGFVMSSADASHRRKFKNKFPTGVS